MTPEHLFYLGIVGGVLLLVLPPIWGKIKAMLPAAAASSTAATLASSIIDTAGKYASEGAGAAACLTLALIAKETGNTDLAATAATAWKQVMDPPAEVTTIATPPKTSGQ